MARIKASLAFTVAAAASLAGRYAEEIADACGVALLADLPWDPQAAHCFSDGAALTRRAVRSPYLRAVRAAAIDIRAEARAETGTGPAAFDGDRVVVMP